MNLGNIVQILHFYYLQLDLSVSLLRARWAELKALLHPAAGCPIPLVQELLTPHLIHPKNFFKTSIYSITTVIVDSFTHGIPNDDMMVVATRSIPVCSMMNSWPLLLYNGACDKPYRVLKYMTI